MNNYYTCEATGNTYPIRDSLKKLGFRYKSESKSWTVEPITEKEKEIFETSRLWPGVKLRFTKHGYDPVKAWER